MAAIENAATIGAAATPAQRRRAATLATLGNVLEWYDFTVYGFLAAYIAATFFPGEDRVASLLSAFAVFAVGFIARPLGALILGPLVDKRGRKSVMLVSMMMMALGSLLVGVAPGYAVAGALGAGIVVLGRLLQGFSAGGEFGSSAVFLVEWADERKRGLYGSFHQIATYGGLIFGVFFVAVLSSVLGPETMAAWGWRIPFLVGAALAIVVLVLRRRITDSPVFEEAESAAAIAERQAERSDSRLPGLVAGFFLTLGVVALWGVTSMVTINYMPTYVSNFAGIEPRSALWAVAIGGILTVALIPVFGGLSDRYGRKVFVIFAAVSYIVLPWPLLSWVVASQSFWAVVTTQLVFAIPTGAMAGVGSSTISELFPTNRRGTLVSIGSAIAVTVFGGFGAYICTWLIQITGITIAPAFYISAVAVLTLITGILLPNLAHRALRA
jgi:MHS family proline/betaine transporter-like MFS transporter